MKSNPGTHSRSGWSMEETNTLFAEARIAGQEGRPIKSVFDKVAMLTGRKPNSIRNYYYLKLKENEDLGKITFVPFEESEVRDLIRTVLMEQAKGHSVRSIAFSLGQGDKKAMLRYQNKYRSVLKNNPDYVRAIMKELEEEGEKFHDPFIGKRKSTKAGNQDVSQVVSELIGNIMQVGQDGEVVINCLNNLVRRAVEAAPGGSIEELQNLRQTNAELTRQLAELRENKQEMAQQLARQVSRVSEMEQQLRTMQAINKSFLQLSGMERLSGLPDYVSALQQVLAR